MILNTLSTAFYFLLLTIPTAVIPIIVIMILRHRFDAGKCSDYFKKSEGIYVYGVTFIVCVFCTIIAVKILTYYW